MHPVASFLKAIHEKPLSGIEEKFADWLRDQGKDNLALAVLGVIEIWEEGPMGGAYKRNLLCELWYRYYEGKIDSVDQLELCFRCEKPGRCRQRNTGYEEDIYNYSFVCDDCHEEDWGNMQEQWDEYNRGRL